MQDQQSFLNSASGMLKGRRGLIMGVANENSLAYSIAACCKQAGAEVAVSYQDDRFYAKIKEICDKIGVDHLIKCDVSDEEEITGLFDYLKSQWESVDFIVHSIAYADASELRGRFSDITKEHFARSLDISCYSLISVSRRAREFFASGASVIALSYLGAEKVVPGYNLMGVAKSALESSVRYLAYDLGREGVRVNAISAGPIKTLSARAISGLSHMLENYEKNSPLRRNISLEEVARSALYLLSDLSSGTTGEILHVDNGYNIMTAGNNS